MRLLSKPLAWLALSLSPAAAAPLPAVAGGAADAVVLRPGAVVDPGRGVVYLMRPRGDRCAGALFRPLAVVDTRRRQAVAGRWGAVDRPRGALAARGGGSGVAAAARCRAARRPRRASTADDPRRPARQALVGCR